MILRNPFFSYLSKFIAAFCLLYFGTQIIIGLSAKGGFYSSFIHDFMNYPSWLRNSLLDGARILLSFFGYKSYVHNAYYLSMPAGRGVRMVYSCLGVGLLSFWTSFVYANRGSLKRKIVWIISGILLIWLINITRVALLLLAVNKKWRMPFNMDNHTLFNISAYAAIFVLIYLYDRSAQKIFKPTDAGS